MVAVKRYLGVLASMDTTLPGAQQNLAFGRSSKTGGGGGKSARLQTAHYLVGEVGLTCARGVSGAGDHALAVHSVYGLDPACDNISS